MILGHTWVILGLMSTDCESVLRKFNYIKLTLLVYLSFFGGKGSKFHPTALLLR
jgi:hypothetical protein